jgi:hypothetical protein
MCTLHTHKHKGAGERENMIILQLKSALANVNG